MLFATYMVLVMRIRKLMTYPMPANHFLIYVEKDDCELTP